MKIRIIFSRLVMGVLLLFLLISLAKQSQASEQGATELETSEEVRAPIPSVPPEKIKIEMALAKKWKKEGKAIKQKLRDASVKKVKIKYFRFGYPPSNIAIGKHVPADIARLAIDIALTYNKEIATILPEFRFFPNYIAIGSSAFDEQAEIPVLPEDVEKLRDPSLSTEEFHAFYRSLTGEDEGLPTYID